MKNGDVIRAWKDPEYRLGLSEAERALLPAHPAGLITLTDAELDSVGGGFFFQLLYRYVAHRVNQVIEVGTAVVKAAGELGAQMDPDAQDAMLRSLS
jgi:mersacidin/lichenicidin family type 2 lantibiotic